MSNLGRLVVGALFLVTWNVKAAEPAKQPSPSASIIPAPPPGIALTSASEPVADSAAEAATVSETVTEIVVAEPASEMESPPAIDLKCGPVTRHLFGHVDYLLWVPRRQAQDFAIQDPAVNAVVDGPIQSAVWDTRSGLRVGVGVQLCSDWDLTGTYTYFHSTGANGLVADAGGSILPTMVRPGLIGAATTAAASSSLDYDVWDVEFGRAIAFSDTFALRLAGGAKFALIDQKLSATYNGIDATNALVTAPIDFDGAGLRLGGEGKWTIWRRFGIYGRAFGSMVAGEFKTSFNASNGGLPLASITQHYRAIVPVAELGLGLMWQGDHLQARIGYEMTNWFDFVDSPDLVDDVTPGKLGKRTSDFSLDGLVISLGFSY